jgi:hypothetical protein
MSAKSLILAALLLSAAQTPPEPNAPEHPNKQINPDAAAEGPRDLEKAKPLFKTFVESQPFGKTWKELAKTEPPPKDPTGLGQAETHKDLKHDPMEVQQQAQYLEDTATTARFGFASIRGVRVFRYGKLRAVQIVIEMVGRERKDKFKEDVEQLAAAWKDPIAALDLQGSFTLKRNDLVDQKKKKPAEYPLPPLRIELEPK